jgi:hypothetical protein
MKNKIFYFFDSNVAKEISRAGKEALYVIEKADMSECKIRVRYNHKGKFVTIDYIG